MTWDCLKILITERTKRLIGNVIFTLIVLVAAFIGIIGSLYHIFGVRGYVMEHKEEFLRIEAMYLGCQPAETQVTLTPDA